MCGVVAHDGCSRRVPDDCRPVAELADRSVHVWHPAGVVLRDREVGPPSHGCAGHCDPPVMASCAWQDARVCMRGLEPVMQHADSACDSQL